MSFYVLVLLLLMKCFSFGINKKNKNKNKTLESNAPNLPIQKKTKVMLHNPVSNGWIEYNAQIFHGNITPTQGFILSLTTGVGPNIGQ